MTDNEEIYRDILDGLSVYFGTALVADLLHTTAQYPITALGNAFNRNQMRSKVWLADKLYDLTQGSPGTVFILGGWYGVLGSILLNDSRFDCDQIVSVDIDDSCKPVAETLNRRYVADRQFLAITANMLEFDFPVEKKSSRSAVIINTSCEHISDFDAWYRRLPGNALITLRSNNFYSCPEHINCVPDLGGVQTAGALARVSLRGRVGSQEIHPIHADRAQVAVAERPASGRLLDTSIHEITPIGNRLR